MLSIRHIDHDCLGLCESPQSSHATLTTHAGFLRPTKRSLNTKHAYTVDTDHSGIQVRRDSQRSGDVLGEDARHQTESGRVGDLDHFVLVLELVHDGDGTEDLFVVDFGIRVYVDKHGGFNEVSLVMSVD